LTYIFFYTRSRKFFDDLLLLSDKMITWEHYLILFFSGTSEIEQQR